MGKARGQKIMDTPGDFPLSKDDLAHLAGEELALVAARLRDARKTLRRDWEQLSPRERSEHSRLARELEAQHQALLDEIEMNRLA